MPADAKGCIKGALIGGIAGHYAGHHGVLGAAAGCVVGHHLAKRRAMQNSSPEQARQIGSTRRSLFVRTV